MDLIREFWWLLPIALVFAILAFVVLRPRQRVRLSDSAPLRPHMAARQGGGAAGGGLGESIGVPVQRKLASDPGQADDLVQLKGVGPKFSETLQGLGFRRFAQIAALSPTEVDGLDQQLGPFRGRLTRDRVVEQADFLARGDIDGFEQRFGKL